MATDGHGQKAIWTGEQHHMAWHFPTLALTPGNHNPMLPVDCFDLPCVINIDHSNEEDSDMEYLVCTDESLSVRVNEDHINLLRETYVELIHEDQDNDNNNAQLLFENVCALVLHQKMKFQLLM